MRVMYYQAPTTTKIATNIPRLFLFKLPGLTGKRLSITCYERSNIVNDSEFADVQHILTSPPYTYVLYSYSYHSYTDVLVKMPFHSSISD
jgi:hypothetical protein